MNKIVVASDSFKGTLTSEQIIDIVKSEVNKRYPKCKVIGVPIADGGEGTIDAFKQILKGKIIKVKSVDAFNNKIIGKYYLTNDKVAIIETASSSGINPKHLDVMNASTLGTGIEINDAIKKGAKKIIIGLGGSATNDGGVGVLSKLGAIFYNAKHKSFIPTGKTLNDIADINISKLKQNIKGIKFIGMSDVTNLMYGSKGATYTFAPQKGAKNKEQLRLLESGIKHLNKLYIAEFKKDVSKKEGSGAAGALGAGILVGLNATLNNGINTLLSLINFDNVIKDADLLITGEGKLDNQSFDGKVISGISKYTKKAKIKTIAIVGVIDKNINKNKLKKSGLSNIYQTSIGGRSFDYIKKHAIDDYRKTIIKVLNEQ